MKQARPPVQLNGMRVRLTPQLHDAISEAARRRGMSACAWLRNAASTVAMLEGVLFPDVRNDGKRRYARIEGGAVVDVQYLADQESPATYALIRDGALVVPDVPFPHGGAIWSVCPTPVEGCEWWPIVENGDPTKGRPTYRAQNGTVVRTYGEVV